MASMKSILFLILLFTIPQISQSAVVDVTGFADLHLHAFFNLSSGGVVDNGGVELTYDELYRVCSKENQSSFWRKLVFSIAPVTASFVFDRPCIPKNKKRIYPNWESVGSQQVWLDSLKKAHEGGMSLAVISLVNSRILCEIHPETQRTYKGCDDTSNIHRQLEAFLKIAEVTPWIELAKTPTEARKIISENKLAVILSIEASDLFDEKDWKKQADEYYEKGVRSFQIVHMFNNRFSGAALYRKILGYGQGYMHHKNHGHFQSFETYTDKEVTPFKTIEVLKNKMGLTEQGRELLTYMVKKGFMIDLAHASEKAITDAFPILEKLNATFYISHGHPREMIDDEMGHFEKATNDQTFLLIKKRKGLFGLRTFYEKTYAYPKSNVPNDCPGSSKSFAQAMSYITDKHEVPVIIASDLNGMIEQTKPRFSKKQKKKCKNEDPKTKQNNEYDETGLGQVAQLPDFINDLKLIGADITPVMKSSQNVIEFWERAVSVAQ